MLRGNFMVVSACIKESELSMNNVMLFLQVLENQEQVNPKMSIRKKYQRSELKLIEWKLKE
jgi:hypothetical protein